MAFNTYVRRANSPFAPDDLTRFLNEDFAKVPESSISTSPTDGAVLRYDASSDLWIDETIEDDLEVATINAQTGTSYTLALSDRGEPVTMDNASANTVTIPTNASVAFDTGSIITVIQKGAGTTTITGDTGVTVNGVSAGSGDIFDQYNAVSLIKIGTDEWIATGSIGSVA